MSARPTTTPHFMNASKSKFSASQYISGRVVMLIGAMVALQTASSFIGVLFIAGLCIWAIRGAFPALQSLSLLPFLLFLNPGFAASHPLLSVLRWLLILAAFAGVSREFFQKRIKLPRLVLVFLLFAAVVCVLSLGWSWARDISLFKLISFTTLGFTSLAGFYLSRDQHLEHQRWLYSLFVSILIFSLPLYFHPYGYFRNGTGFQGIFNQPQLFGIVLAPFATWTLAKILNPRQRSKTFLYIILALSVFFIFSSRARTAGGGFVISSVVMVWASLLRSPRFRFEFVRLLLRPVSILAFLFFCTLLPFLWPSVKSSATKFLHKDESAVYDGSIEIGEHFEASRGALVERSMENFKKHPLTGIGFGIPSDPYTLSVTRSGPLGIPVSAPVEKGVVWSGALEEVGIIGFSVLLLLMMSMFIHAARAPDPAFLGIFVACIAVNTGEMILFSAGGIGGFFWLLIGFAVFAPIPKLHAGGHAMHLSHKVRAPA